LSAKFARQILLGSAKIARPDTSYYRGDDVRGLTAFAAAGLAPPVVVAT
jgi:hypothetical protein